MLTVEEIEKLIKIDKNSSKKRKARIGQNYYEARHDILDYKLFYFSDKDELVEDTSRSNIKIPHAFFTELVDQEIQFLLSKFSIGAKNESNKILDDELKERFDDEYKSELADTCESMSVKGWGYMYGFLAEDNRTRYKNADSLGVIEVRADEASDATDHVVYYYIDRINEKKKAVQKIEVWDSEFRYFYIKIGKGKLQLDPNETINPRPHKVYKKDNQLLYRPSEPGYRINSIF